jgi:nucleotide-binding universal stress UspA family protein
MGVAIDGASEGWRALHAGAALTGTAAEGTSPGNPTARSLELLTVMEPPHYALGGLLSPMGPDEYRAHKEREAASVFDAAREHLEAELPFETRLLHGAPAEELAAAAQDLDLLIVGSRAYGPVRGTLLGSVSAKLMASSPTPLLVVARGSGSHPLDD